MSTQSPQDSHPCCLGRTGLYIPRSSRMHTARANHFVNDFRISASRE